MLRTLCQSHFQGTVLTVLCSLSGYLERKVHGDCDGPIPGAYGEHGAVGDGTKVESLLIVKGGKRAVRIRKIRINIMMFKP